MILMVVELADPLAPVSVGAEVNITVETLAPGLEPKLVPLNKTLAPAVLDKLAKVIMLAPPEPGLTVTMFKPLLKLRAPACSDVFALEEPIKLKYPPFIVMVEESLKRLVLFALELSKLSIAP
jgi:hypothetical protein